MEFVEGGNLKDFLKIRRKLEPAEALAILEDAAAGLAYASSRGVTHRDMKLSNVLISAQGAAKLVDFGLAGLSQRLHKDGTQVDRTVDYAGLEKATNAPHGDIRSDIYFLGCVVYELLTGRSPLEKSKNPHERMRSQRFVSVKPMGADEVKAPPSVFRLVEKMMALNPAERYQTPSQLFEAVREVRRELEGKAADGKEAPSAPTLFILQKDLRLQDKLREHFKRQGYRVLMAGEPSRAIERYQQQPFDALILDAGTVGEDGALVFDRIMKEAERHRRRCAGVVILSENQEDLRGRITARPNVVVLVRPVTIKQLQRALEEILDARPGAPPAEQDAAEGGTVAK
jgi:CheY-like chemotaxis protein